MNQKNNYFKNLFKTELNRDLFKIILVMMLIKKQDMVIKQLK